MKSDVNGREQSEVIDNSNTWAMSATGVSTSAVTLTMPAVAGLTACITGVTVTGVHATATVESLFKITGLTTFQGGGELDYQFVQSSTLGGLLDLDFSNPIPASAPNIAIVFNLAAITGGGTVSICAQGFYRR